MLTFVQSLRNEAGNTEAGSWLRADVDSLRLAEDVLKSSAGAVEAVATLRGYHAFMAGRREERTPTRTNGVLPIGDAPPGPIVERSVVTRHGIAGLATGAASRFDSPPSYYAATNA